ncbi:MAG: flippase-like domain-containing protein, partial [Candidatus Aenigmarchaeota archaeon]|nr:flippase-like domain-containing protein [Candidatus Aenigmarchaeota archaeon]
MKKRLGDVLLFVIAIGLLSGLIVHSNPAVIAKTLSGANLVFVVGAVSITLLIIGVKIVRWNILLGSLGIKLTLKQVMQPYMASLFVSNITPGRVGEPIRSYYLKKSTGHRISKTLPTVVVERIMDLSVVVLFCFYGLLSLSSISNPMLITGIGIMVFGLVVVVGVSTNKNFFHRMLK